MFADPTMAAAINVWGETVSLLRDPAVSLVGVLSKPDTLMNFGALQVDDADGQLAVLKSDLEPLSAQVGEKIQAGSQVYRIQAITYDDGAGALLLLKRVKPS